MTLTAPAPPPGPAHAPRKRSLWSQLPRGPQGLVLAAFLAVAAAGATQVTEVARLSIGLIGLFVFILISISDRDLALKSIVVWLVFLGFIRRFLIPFAGWSPQDPLLLVSPAVAVLLLITGRRLGTPPRTLTASIAMFLGLWSGVQVLNPFEPSLGVAAQASLFYVAPVLWFFVGRTMTKRQHDMVLDVVFWAAIPVIFHGLYQSFVGLLPFEYSWLGVSDIGPAVFLPGFVIRPFSTLVSPQEYGIFLAMALAVVYGRVLVQRSHRAWLLAYFVVGLTALFLQASRTTFLFFILMVGIMTVVRLRSLPILIATVAVGVAVILYSFANPVARPDEVEGEEPAGGANPATLMAHQLSGLTNPSNSTAPLHLELILEGLEEGLSNPLGVGASRGTIASARFATEEFRSAENDIANITAALGVPAGLALLLFMATGLGGARRLFRSTGDVRYLIWLGFGVACFFNWYNGGLYTVTMLLWLSIGGVSREIGEQRIAKQQAITPAVPALRT